MRTKEIWALTLQCTELHFKSKRFPDNARNEHHTPPNEAITKPASDSRVAAPLQEVKECGRQKQLKVKLKEQKLRNFNQFPQFNLPSCLFRFSNFISQLYHKITKLAPNFQ